MQPTRPRRAGARLVSALIAAVFAVVALGGFGTARAQAPDATFAYVVYPAGWNLIATPPGTVLRRPDPPCRPAHGRATRG